MRGIKEILLINTTKYAELVMKISVLTAYLLNVSYSSNPNRREITTRQSLIRMANFILFDFILFTQSRQLFPEMHS
jgi:hypothetical protein